jgi:hypothetical protein
MTLSPSGAHCTKRTNAQRYRKAEAGGASAPTNSASQKFRGFLGLSALGESAQNTAQTLDRQSRLHKGLHKGPIAQKGAQRAHCQKGLSAQRFAQNAHRPKGARRGDCTKACAKRASKRPIAQSAIPSPKHFLAKTAFYLLCALCAVCCTPPREGYIARAPLGPLLRHDTPLSCNTIRFLCDTPLSCNKAHKGLSGLAANPSPKDREERTTQCA